MLRRRSGAQNGGAAQFRLLPVLIAAATILLGIKVGHVWDGVLALGPADARAEPEQARSAEEPSELGPKAAQAEETSGLARGSEPAKDAEPLSAAELSPSEIEVLQQLAGRREELDRRAADLQVRENLLKATEKRIEERIQELKQLEARIEATLVQRDAEAERKIKSLVKVYENMKPRDAARIFEQLGMDVLLEVAERMREQKIAPILADMDPQKAKELTVELATRKDLPIPPAPLSGG